MIAGRHGGQPSSDTAEVPILAQAWRASFPPIPQSRVRKHRRFRYS
jgi:hypothetical protein